MTAAAKAVEPWLATGAALYWGAIVASFLLAGAQGSPACLFADSAAKYLLLAAFVGVGAACPRLFSTSAGRRGSLVAMLCASAAAWALPLVSDAPVCADVAMACHIGSIAVLMVLWGFAFASMDKRTAGVNVTVTMLLAVFAALATVALGALVPVLLVVRVLMIASACVLLSGRVRFRDAARPPVRAARRDAAAFLGSRVAFGVVLGFGIEAPLRLATSDASPALLVLAMALTCAALAVSLRRAERLYFALPTLLLLTVGLTYLPFFEGGLATGAAACVGLVWLVWAEFSAFQLSDLKERVGASELALCLAEKLALSLAMVAGVLACRVLAATGLLDAPEAFELVLFAGSGALVLGAAYVTGCLVGERAEDRMRAQLAQTRRQHAEAVYDAIAAEHGLTEREREVMGMLAEGYTRAYVRDALGVSDGTAKAHIAHVYAKLDIHRKDDLLAYIDARVSGE